MANKLVAAGPQTAPGQPRHADRIGGDSAGLHCPVLLQISPALLPGKVPMKPDGVTTRSLEAGHALCFFTAPEASGCTAKRWITTVVKGTSISTPELRRMRCTNGPRLSETTSTSS